MNNAKTLVDEEWGSRPWHPQLQGKPVFEKMHQAVKQALQKAQAIIDSAAKEYRISFADIPMDDPAVFELLRAGDTEGVFELESEGMRMLLRKISPQNFEHLKAALALYRPGPLGSGMADHYINVRCGRQPFPWPGLEFHLGRTYGQILYREQFYQILEEHRHFDPIEAKRFLYQICNKEHLATIGLHCRDIATVTHFFAEGKKWSPRKIQQFRETLILHGKLAMTESHVASYAHLNYRMAWLKANFTNEFSMEYAFRGRA